MFTDNDSQAQSFNQFGLSAETLSILATKNITTPTAVQKLVIPAISSNQNVVFESETGTGKTLAYLLPLLNQIEQNIKNTQVSNVPPVVKMIIVSPTYELASQIKSEVQSVTKLKACLFIGTSPIKRQIELLKEKPVIAVGGPSRILELIRLKKLKINNVTSIVFDEVDRLLSPELRDDTCALLTTMPKTVQLVACSATIPRNTTSILQNSLPRDATGDSSNSQENDNTKTVKNSEITFIKLPPEDVLRLRITHWAFYSEERDKADLLRRFIAAEKPEKVLVFTSKVSQVEQIVDRLQHKNVDCMGMSAKADKTERKAAIDRFRSGKCNILVTSDLAARGLDIQNISHIVQMDFPSNTDFFIHRAGRTGRAGKKGINVVIGDSYEIRKYAELEKKLGITVYPKELYGGKVVSPQNTDDSSSCDLQNEDK